MDGSTLKCYWTPSLTANVSSKHRPHTRISTEALFVDGIASHASSKERKAELAYLAYDYRSDSPSVTRVTAALSLEQDPHLYVPRIDGDPFPQSIEDTEAIWVATGGNTLAHIGSSVVHKHCFCDCC